MKFARPLLLSALFLTGCSTPGDGTSPSAGSAPAHSLGSGTAKDSGGTCSVGLSAPSGSPLKNQKITFVLQRGTLGGWSAQEFPVSTGTAMSLADLQSRLGSALRRGLTAPAGSELAKVGDIKYGGEVRLVAFGGGQVEFRYQPPLDQGANPRLSAGETAIFAQLLGQ